MTAEASPLTPARGTAAGVPYVAHPPADGREEAPLVVAWHLSSPPRSETAMAAALPLRGLGAWRVYLGLPMHGTRLPEGGLDQFLQLFREDMVLNVFDSVTREVAEEFPAALAELRDQLQIGRDAISLLGGSMGAAVAASVLADADVPVGAVALVSPAIRVSSVVERYERLWQFGYRWTDPARAVAERLDFVARADELAARDAATLLVVGAEDDENGFREPAERLHEALARRSPEHSSLVQIPGMEHALAAEPGLEPAPQSEAAERVDRVVADWLRSRITSPAAGHPVDASRAANEPGKPR